LKETAASFTPTLEQYDTAMTEVLKTSKNRTRTTVYRKLLERFRNWFIDAVVVPMMHHEGSPAQAAARQLEEIFGKVVSNEEAQYIAEAARCSSVKCQRAAIVMLWAAAIARFHSQIQFVGFDAYNSAAAASIKKKGSPFNRISNSINVASLAD